MLKKITASLNAITFVFLILAFDHIGQYQYFGFLYSWIDVILISFTLYFIISMPYYFRKPRGLYVLLVGIFFLSMQFLTSTPEMFRNSAIFISFIIIISIVVKNSDHLKLKAFLRIITYCCLINLIFEIYHIVEITLEQGQSPLGRKFRSRGLDKAPVLFGYNMLLGFWLVLMNSIIQPDANKSSTKLDKYFAFAFFIGILLSKSTGALLGLVIGGFAMIFCVKKINQALLLNSLIILILLSVMIFITSIYFPSFYWDVLGFKRLYGKIEAVQNVEALRFGLWNNMFTEYFKQMNVLNLFFGGGQGHGKTLIGRGVHSDHLKFLFDHGVVGLLIYYYKVLSCLRLVKEFNIYLVGFIVSTLASGLFYVNFGSITNSFTCILALIVLSNYNKFKT